VTVAPAAEESDGSHPAVSAFDEGRFKEVLGHFATGVTIVTAMEDAAPVGFTCQAFTALSLDPPMVALAPAKSSTSWPRIARAGAFCVNVLESRQEAVCRAFAVSGGDKFSGIAWHPGATGAPVIEGSLAVIECRLGIIHDAGDHELVTGHVLSMEVGQGVPLLFYRGGFAQLSP
jgi:flavin reductase (DIM6/NTAB) family NADH-FMN oxidoreductase RutF